MEEGGEDEAELQVCILRSFNFGDCSSVAHEMHGMQVWVAYCQTVQCWWYECGVLEKL